MTPETPENPTPGDGAPGLGDETLCALPNSPAVTALQPQASGNATPTGAACPGSPPLTLGKENDATLQASGDATPTVEACPGSPPLPPPLATEDDGPPAPPSRAATDATSRGLCGSVARFRSVHPESIQNWGGFALTYSISANCPRGRWQAVCP